MKYFYFFLVLFSGLTVFGQTCSTCTIIISSGSWVNVNLTTGKDVICITGTVNNINANNLGQGDDEICIQGGGTLNWSLPPINQGTLTININSGGTLNESAGSYNGRVTIHNEGNLNFLNGITFQGNPGNNITNYASATTTITGSLFIAQNNFINNYGEMTITNNADISEGNFVNHVNANLSVTNELYIHSDQFSTSGMITAGSLRFTNKAGDGPEFFPSSTTIITGNIYVDATVILNGYLETVTGSVTFTSNGRDNGAQGMLVVSSTSSTPNSIIQGGGYYQGGFFDADNNGGLTTTPGQPVTSALHGFDQLTILSQSQNLNNIMVQNPLPVTLIYFEGKQVNEEVLVAWSTSAESNNAYFELMKSVDNIDYHVVKKIDGQGAAEKIQKYEYVDSDIESAIAYYKLKQTDFDGKFTISDPISILIRNDKSQSEVYPNPTNGLIEIKGDYTGGIEIVSFTGKVIYTANILDNNKIDISNVPAGVYIVRFIENGNTFKLLKN